MKFTNSLVLLTVLTTTSTVVDASVGGGLLQLDDVCAVTRQGNSYIADGEECDHTQNLECGDVDDSGSNTKGTVFYGTCQSIECTGKADPDRTHPHDDNHATDRVTICHRTCSPKNPWVRITIDKDAWGTTYRGDEDNGTSGCGHKLQHNVTEDCNRDDYTPWAPWFADYLIKDHGKKDGDYGETYNNAYWREWEPACPYVRNGACCDPDTYVDRGDGVMVTNCCGEGTFERPPDTCPEMHNTGDSKCPGYDGNIVDMLAVQGYPLPVGEGVDADVIYDIQFEPDAGAHGQVSFKVDNPWEFNTDVYVEFHEEVGSHGAFDVECVRDLNKPGCDPGADTITGICINRAGKKFTIVNVYFVTADDTYFADTPEDLVVPECCEYYDHNGATGLKMAKYTFEIQCECPSS